MTSRTPTRATSKAVLDRPTKGSGRKINKPELYLVFGGTVRDPQGLDYLDPSKLHTVGYFRTYEEAYAAWQGASQRHVDEASTKYIVVELL
jgi:hypothetical protein